MREKNGKKASTVSFQAACLCLKSSAKTVVSTTTTFSLNAVTCSLFELVEEIK